MRAIARPRVDQRGDPEADRRQLAPGGRAHLLDGLHQGVQQLLGALALAGVTEHAMVDVEVGVDDPGKQLRAAEIDADHAPGGHARHPIRWMSTPTDPATRVHEVPIAAPASCAASPSPASR